MRGYPKTTGKRGIQIWIPIEPRYTFADTSDWVERISRAIGSTVPDLVSWDWAKANRGGKARLDYTQNATIKTLVAPYAVRPSAGAPVSAPIAWDELDDPTLRPTAGRSGRSSSGSRGRRPVRRRPDGRPGAAAGLRSRRLRATPVAGARRQRASASAERVGSFAA